VIKLKLAEKRLLRKSILEESKKGALDDSIIMGPFHELNWARMKIVRQ
jgi:hypothetical protein